MKYGSKEQQQKTQVDQTNSISKEIPPTVTPASPQQQENDSDKPSELIEKKLRGLRFRLAPSLHKCKECDVVFTSQLGLNQHLEQTHNKESCLVPQRPLTLQMRTRPSGLSATSQNAWTVLVNWCGNQIPYWTASGLMFWSQKLSTSNNNFDVASLCVCCLQSYVFTWT